MAKLISKGHFFYRKEVTDKRFTNSAFQ